MALIDSCRKVKITILAYIAKLGLKICQTIVKVQKSKVLFLQIFGIIIAYFQVSNKLGRAYFF